MVRKIGFGLLWVGFIAYAFLLAPPDRPDTLELITRLSRGDIAEINPLIVALFNIMGLWPIAYSSLLLVDGRGQKIPAFPFAIASFALGAFALLPYLALRQANPTFSGPKDGLLKALDSRLLGILLTVGAIALVLWGFARGDWSDFAQQWQTSRFIHVMSLDFCLLSLLFSALLGDDLARRGLEHRLAFWGVVLIPLFGPLLYLSLRPPLAKEGEEEIPGSPQTAIDKL
jgi:hypothetical protein